MPGEIIRLRPSWAAHNPQPHVMWWIQLSGLGLTPDVVVVGAWRDANGRILFYSPGNFPDVPSTEDVGLDPSLREAILGALATLDEDEDEDEDEPEPEELCESCECPLDECECRECNDCGSRINTNHETFCLDCYRCGDCGCDCSHSGRGELELVDHGLHFYKGGPYKVWPSRRMAAVEIEVSSTDGYYTNRACDKWKMTVKTDGSVPDGAEINTSPACGDQFIMQLTDLGNAMRSDNTEADYHCGVHVHVDTRDFTYGQMGVALSVYSWIEQAVFKLVPPERRTSEWAAPRAERIIPLGFIDALRKSPSAFEWKEKILALLANVRPEWGPPEEPRRPERRHYFSHIQTCPGEACRATSRMWDRLITDVQDRLYSECAAAGINADWPSWHPNYRARNYYAVAEEYVRQVQQGLRLLGFPGRRELGACDHDMALSAAEAEWNYALGNYNAQMREYRRLLTRIRKGRIPLPYGAMQSSPNGKYPHGGGNLTVGGRRYYAFNLISWFEHGTIEIRLHQGSADTDEILPWACFWTAFFDEVKRMPPDEAHAMITAPQDKHAPARWMYKILARRNQKFADALAARWGAQFKWLDEPQLALPIAEPDIIHSNVR